LTNETTQRVEIRSLDARLVIKKPSNDANFSFYIDNPIKITGESAREMGSHSRLIDFHPENDVPNWHLEWENVGEGRYTLDGRFSLDSGDTIYLPRFLLKPTNRANAIELLENNTAILEMALALSTDRGGVSLSTSVPLKMQPPPSGTGQ
jgi:hypothetical protein